MDDDTNNTSNKKLALINESNNNNNDTGNNNNKVHHKHSKTINNSIPIKYNNNNNGNHKYSHSLSDMHIAEMLNKLDGEQRTALSHACEKGQLQVIEFLVKQNGIDLELGGKHHDENWTNLHWACRYGHSDIVQLLIDNSANIDAQTSKKSYVLNDINIYIAIILGIYLKYIL